MRYQYIVLEFHSDDLMSEPTEHIREKESRADSLARDLALVSPKGIARVEKWEMPHEVTDWKGSTYIVPGKQIGDTIEYNGSSGMVVKRTI